jgi:hypothetical protein
MYVAAMAALRSHADPMDRLRKFLSSGSNIEMVIDRGIQQTGKNFAAALLLETELRSQSDPGFAAKLLQGAQDLESLAPKLAGLRLRVTDQRLQERRPARIVRTAFDFPEDDFPDNPFGGDMDQPGGFAIGVTGAVVIVIVVLLLWLFSWL